MLSSFLVVYSDYVSSNTTVYTDSRFNDDLGRHDQLARHMSFASFFERPMGQEEWTQPIRCLYRGALGRERSRQPRGTYKRLGRD
jgi:hypothetical protein